MSVSVQNRRIRLRSAVAAGLTALLLVPTIVLFIQVCESIADERTSTSRERSAVQYLTGLDPLLTALVDAQATAVRQPPAGVPAAQPASTGPTALGAAVAGVADIDAAVGADLGTTSRWAGLRSRIERLPTAASGNPAAAYQAYVEAGDLLLALYAAVADHSGLSRDPARDVAYLQRAAAVGLPETVLHAARLADLSRLTAQPGADAKQLQPQLPGLRLTVETSLDELTGDLQAAGADTDSRTLSGGLLATVDDMRRSIETLLRVSGKTDPDPVPQAAARGSAERARTELGDTVRTEIDGLLRSRLSALDNRAVRAQVTLGAAVLVALLALLTILDGRGRPDAPR
ncbi:MAG TPA: hypothetical protein VFO77_10155 [Actinoplanes sp.]|nr:hypothetical protein [Actinoplanes sp.]